MAFIPLDCKTSIVVQLQQSESDLYPTIFKLRIYRYMGVFTQCFKSKLREHRCYRAL